MTWKCFGLVALVAIAACQKPNLQPTEGGYGGRDVAQASAAAAEPASAPVPADTAAPATADTATP
jgi:hypothetical protein